MADVDPMPLGEEDQVEEVDNPTSKAADGADFSKSLSRFGGSTQAADQAAAVQKLQQAAFGTVSEDGEDLDEDEEEVDMRMRERWFGILHPDMHTRGLYDMGQLIIMIWLGWLLPTRLAFNKTASGAWEVMFDLVIDGSVWVDMYMQTHMCSYDSKTKKLIHDRRKIKRNYLRSWFLVDFFSVVPADQILLVIGTLMVEYSKGGTNLQIGLYLNELSVSVRMMRLLRLVRLLKIKDLLNLDRIIHNIFIITHHIGMTKLQLSFYFRIFFLVGLIICSGHFLGCVWLMLGRHNVLQMINPEGWMVNAYAQDTVNHTKDFVACIGGSFSDTAWNQKHGMACQNLGGPAHACAPIPELAPYDVDCSWIEDRSTSAGGTGIDDGVGASEGEQYLSAFYFSLVTVTTVGYGDILPDTPAEKQFVILCIVTGAFLYAYVIGDFTLLLANLSQERDEYDSKMRSVNDLLSYIDAPPEIRTKVQNYYDFKFSNKEGKSELISELPTPLQIDLVKHRYGKLISRVPFFATLNDRAVVDLCMQMKSFTVTPGDPIMSLGEWNDELLVLSKGTARTEARGEDGKYTTFDVGQFWGEMQFLGLERQRTMTIVSGTYCEVASLAPEDMSKLTYGMQITHRLQAYAETRQTVELQMARGETVDMKAITLELEERYKEVDDDSVAPPPPPIKKKEINPEEGGALGEAVMDTLHELQKAQRATETQLARMSEKNNTQLAQMADLLTSMQAQIKEQGAAQAAAAAAAAAALTEARAEAEAARAASAEAAQTSSAAAMEVSGDEVVEDS